MDTYSKKILKFIVVAVILLIGFFSLINYSSTLREEKEIQENLNRLSTIIENISYGYDGITDSQISSIHSNIFRLEHNSYRSAFSNSLGESRDVFYVKMDSVNHLLTQYIDKKPNENYNNFKRRIREAEEKIESSKEFSVKTFYVIGRFNTLASHGQFEVRFDNGRSGILIADPSDVRLRSSVRLRVSQVGELPAMVTRMVNGYQTERKEYFPAFVAVDRDTYISTDEAKKALEEIQAEMELAKQETATQKRTLIRTYVLPAIPIMKRMNEILKIEQSKWE